MSAYLEISLPPGAWLSGADQDNRVALEPGKRIWIGRGSANDVVVHGLMIGGQRNCCLELMQDGTALLSHAGHALGIEVDGERMAPHAEARVLRSGSVFAPEGDRPGLVFRLVIERER